MTAQPIMSVKDRRTDKLLHIKTVIARAGLSTATI